MVYFEPYVMNSSDVFARIQAGDYEGTRTINGVERKSIFREYADSVVNGLVEYYSEARGIVSGRGRSSADLPPETARATTLLMAVAISSIVTSLDRRGRTYLRA